MMLFGLLNDCSFCNWFFHVFIWRSLWIWKCTVYVKYLYKNTNQQQTDLVENERYNSMSFLFFQNNIKMLLAYSKLNQNYTPPHRRKFFCTKLIRPLHVIYIIVHGWNVANSKRNKERLGKSRFKPFLRDFSVETLYLIVCYFFN